jgi:hypothetical protein
MNRSLLVVLIIWLAGCVYHDIPADCSGSDLSLTVDTVSLSTTCNSQNGAMTISAAGGKDPYVFSIDGMLWQHNPNFSGLPSGVYTVRIKDFLGCGALVENVLIGVKEFDAQFDATPDSTCGQGSGSLTITVNETNGPYMFRMDDGGFVSTNVIKDIEEGDHFLTIRDIDNCMVTISISIPHKSTGVSWQHDILPIFETSCAISGCHDGITRLDWRNYDNVKNYASSIKENTQNKSMPFDSTLPQEKIDLIACWVDDGAPKN